MIQTSLITLVLMAPVADQALARLPASIAIEPNDRFGGWKIAPTESSARFALELGDSLEGALVELVPQAGDERRLVVQVQVETSITIMDQGPHLDLLDWKHHRSDWVAVERIGELRFRMPRLESDPDLVSRFPAYTNEELHEAALKAGGRRWAEIVRRSPDPEDGYVAVAISAVRIRVVAIEAGEELVLFTLRVDVPMGC